MLRLPLDVGGANVFRQHHKYTNQKHAAENSLTEAQVSDARNWSNLQGEAGCFVSHASSATGRWRGQRISPTS